ncbi:MAG: hypothetical protein WA637_01550 [Terriglobales bacterium]
MVWLDPSSRSLLSQFLRSRRVQHSVNVVATAAGAGAFTVEAGVAFTAEVEAAGFMVAAVASIAEAAEGFTPVAEGIAAAAPTGARGLSVEARVLLAEETTVEAGAFVAGQRQAATEQAGDPTAGSVPRAA